MATFKAEDFTLEVSFINYKEEKIFNNIITNYTVRIAVKCFDYSAITEFYISKEEWVGFIKRLTELYDSLKVGVAGISDYEPDQNNLYFNSDGTGNFIISGVFNNWGDWTLKFEKSFDQTYFRHFIKQLNDELSELNK
ncbi:MAG: hypothetical protein ACI4QN_05245 [Candidatus Coproplasma sp.]